MFMKIHTSEKNSVLAICDKELIGRKLKGKNIYLDLETYASFYKGLPVNERAVLLAAAEATSFNLVGEKSIELMSRLKLLSAKEKKFIKKIQGVPHLQLYRI